MKKLAFLLAVVMAAGMVFAGCGSKPAASPAADGGNAPAANGEKITISVWSWDVALKQLEAAAEKFKVDNPNVEFDFKEMGTDQVYAKLSTSLATGTGLADVIQLEGEMLSGYAAKFPEGFATMDDIVKPDDFLPVKIGEVSSGGKIFGFPWDAGPQALFYRIDYFEQAGVKPEEIVTWADFIEAGKKVTAACKTPDGKPVKMLPVRPGATTMFRILLQQQGTFYFDDQSNTIVNSEKSVKAAALLKEMYDAGICQDYNDWGEYEGVVVNETVATIPEAVWMIGTIKDKGPQTAGKWGVIQLPQFNAGESAASSNGGSLLTVPAKSPNAEMAKKFVQFALTDEQLQVDGFVNYGLYPSYKPVYQNEIFGQADEFFGNQKIYDIFVNAGNNIPQFNYTENFNEANDVVGNAMSKILLKGEDVKTTMDNLQAELVAKFGK